MISSMRYLKHINPIYINLREIIPLAEDIKDGRLGFDQVIELYLKYL